MNEQKQVDGPWYAGVTRYQWLVLIVASLGWIFDVFEGQIFVVSEEAMPSLLPAGTPEDDVAYYNNIAYGAFLVGGALGGVLFGMLSDRIGRKRTLTYTILTYSLFTCLSALAATWWQLAGFRFLVAFGTGGEWAVASALVAEVFPSRARARSQSIFHASSVLGTYLAVAAGSFIIANPRLGWSLSLFGREVVLTGWRMGFLIGVLPALLIIWVRVSLREPEMWQKTRTAPGTSRGSIAQLFTPTFRLRTLIGVGLAAVGLATFWGTHIYGKNVFQDAYQARTGIEDKEILKHANMFGMFLVTTGGGLGLLAFGPICERLGRRGAFLLFHLGGLAAALLLFQGVSGLIAVGVVLPIFGFLTLGMHAGYAVYFPELFPTRLRSTGAGFCFNVGRILAAPILILSGWMRKVEHISLNDAAALLSLLFLLGALLLLLAPETKGQDLPA
ncbi:MAG TPA: MFS transporter [Gemmataceae bacterium]